MNLNNEFRIAIANHKDQRRELLDKFRKANQTFFSTLELEQLIDFVQEYATQKSNHNDQTTSITKKQQERFATLIYLLQDIIDSIVPVVTTDRYRSVLALFDALQLKYCIPIKCPSKRYSYIDIADIRLLSVLDKEQENELIIGVDESFITALHQCAEWCLYSVLYDKQFLIKANLQYNKPILRLSALGLFKRIISYSHKIRIHFFFKDNNERQHLTYNELYSLCKTTLMLDVNRISKQSFDIFPVLLKHYIDHQISKSLTLQSIVIQLLHKKEVKKTTDRLKEECFYKDCFAKVQQVNSYHHQPQIILQVEIGENHFASYILDDIWHYEHQVRRLNHEGKTIIETLRDAWSNKAIVFTI